MLLKERYSAIRFLGEGGFAKTFEAVDKDRLDTRCVIKQFFPQIRESTALKKATELFQQEAHRLNNWGKHPQISNLLAYFEQEKRLYLVQDFIDGQDLFYYKNFGKKAVLARQKFGICSISYYPFYSIFTIAKLFIGISNRTIFSGRRMDS